TQGRDRRFKAILPLRGKILNVEQARLDKMLANNEIKSLIIAMGIGIGEVKDLAKLRYARIVIMTDADVDGAHIRTLLLTFFFRYFPELIEGGHLYIAQPPLFKLQKGKDVRYAYSDKEKDKIMGEWGVSEDSQEVMSEGAAAEVEVGEGAATEEEEAVAADAAKKKSAGRVTIQRYKGLGEMNPEQLKETTMDPKVRTMLRVLMDDAERAELVFSTLMGSEVGPRRKFIQTHAKTVKNLDI
ncbi:MAG TPA: toprim domain-containing protein, partial [Candidatus Peribacteraceae bacterium]|nr:toprim domain-containing protein [Candidatus Peribacteraceae bacterium]